MKGSVLPDELCEELVEPEEELVEPEEELTELGADWDSVDELEVVEVVVDAPVLLAFVLWWPE